LVTGLLELSRTLTIRITDLPRVDAGKVHDLGRKPLLSGAATKIGGAYKVNVDEGPASSRTTAPGNKWPQTSSLTR
jgi:hypothetical protein